MTIPYITTCKRIKITRWKINNREGWAKYNEEITNKLNEIPPTDYAAVNQAITETLKQTVGQRTITIGPKQKKESDQTKKLRAEKRRPKRTLKKHQTLTRHKKAHC